MDDIDLNLNGWEIGTIPGFEIDIPLPSKEKYDRALNIEVGTTHANIMNANHLGVTVPSGGGGSPAVNAATQQYVFDFMRGSGGSTPN